MLCVAMELGWFYIRVVLYSMFLFDIPHGNQALIILSRHLTPKTPTLGNSKSDWTSIWLKSCQQSETLLNVTEISWDRQSCMDIKKSGVILHECFSSWQKCFLKVTEL